MMRLVPIVLLLTFLALAPAQARKLAGVEMPDTAVVDGATLKLNGMGCAPRPRCASRHTSAASTSSNPRATPRPSSIRSSASV
jgi:hypothetical protein